MELTREQKESGLLAGIQPAVAGLPVSGLGALQGVACSVEKAYFNVGLVQMGDQGADVQALQVDLRDMGYYTGNLDGAFGPLTESAVRAFQQAAGLAVDGIVGPETKRALCDVLEASGGTGGGNGGGGGGNGGGASGGAGIGWRKLSLYVGVAGVLGLSLAAIKQRS